MIRDIDRFNHMLDAVHKALVSVEGLSKEQFLANDDKKAAAERYIMIIGEASNMISDEIKAKYPEVDWQDWTDMRNIVAHAYMRVDYNIVWDTIKSDMPKLEQQLKDMVAIYPWPLS